MMRSISLLTQQTNVTLAVVTQKSQGGCKGHLARHQREFESQRTAIRHRALRTTYPNRSEGGLLTNPADRNANQRPLELFGGLGGGGFRRLRLGCF